MGYTSSILMHVVARVVRRAVWLVWLCLLAGPHTAHASGLTVSADFDGDGRYDRAELERRESSLLRGWFSASHSTSVVHSSTPLLTIAATDLDGDGRHELIASGTLGRLQVWTKRRHGFTRLHPHQGAPVVSSGQAPLTVDDESEDTSGAEVPPSPSTLSLALTRRSPPPPPLAAPPATRPVIVPPQSELLARFGSRPPPLIKQL